MSKKLVKSTVLFATNTFFSRILGFVRDMVFAQLFGATAGLDAFLVAFRIPNFMRRLFAEGAFSQAFVPVLSEYRHHQSRQQVLSLISGAMGTLAMVLLVAVILGMIFAPIITHIFAPGFAADGQRHQLATAMLRITFPYLLFISMVAVCAAVLNTYGSFGLPAFVPIFLNLSLISCAIYLAPRLSIAISALAWGVFIAGVLQLLFLLPVLYQKGLLVWPRVAFTDSGVRQVLSLMVPAIFGVSVSQINLLLDTLFASFLSVGSVSWLYYSERLMMFPLGIFGVAIATVLLPQLSRHAVSENRQRYQQALDSALRVLLLLGFPAVVALFFLAGPLLSTLFQYQSFNAYDVLMARKSLMAFAVGLQSFMLIKVLAAGFYAYKDIKTPVKIAVVAMLSNIVLNLLLIVPLQHAGIALATSLSAILNSGMLWWQLKQKNIYHPCDGWLKYLLRLLLANGLLALFLFFTSGQLSVWLQQSWHWRLWHLLVLIIVAIPLYFAILFLSGLRVKDFTVLKS